MEQKGRGGKEDDGDLRELMLEPKEEKHFFQKSLKILFVVALYWVVSISMVFINKHLLSSPDYKLDAPLFITWFQCVVAVACCWVLGTLSGYFDAFKIFPPFEVELELCKQTTPLSLVFVGMISFNNLCLKFMGVSFYNVGRSLTTVFNVVLTYFVLGEKTSLPALLACGVIIAGFFLGVDQEGNTGELSLQGIIYGVLASACVALNSIFVKRALPLMNNNTWRLTLYNNLNASFLFLPLIVMFGEVEEIKNFTGITDFMFWFLMTVGGAFGIAIGLVTMLQVRHTSPLTHNISGTAKACFQTALSVYVNQEDKSGLWWGSNFMVLGGSLAYARVRQLEMKANQLPK